MDDRILALVALARANGGGLKLALVGGSSNVATVSRKDNDEKLPNIAGGRSLWIELQDRARLNAGSLSPETGNFPVPKEKAQCRVTMYPAEGRRGKPWMEFSVVES